MLYRLSGMWWNILIRDKISVQLSKDFFLLPGGEVIHLNEEFVAWFMESVKC